MSAKQTSMGGEDMIGRDERLGVLLRQWKGPDPRGDFDAQVWRTIRSEPASAGWPGFGIGAFRDRIMARTAWASAVAAAVGIAVGVWAGVSVSRQPSARQHGEALIHAQTLAGSYLALTSGGAR